jgi:Lrp/AsnC family transcriptional regulator for asnA, asnC and gidA
MDELDIKIINELQRDGRMPYTDIAKSLNVSEGTVRNRVARLIDEQVIHIVGMLDPTQVGFDAPAMIGVSVQPAMLESIAETIASFPEVSYLIMVSGEFDLFVEVFCRDRDDLAAFLNQKLHQVNGVVRTQTFMTLKIFKMAYGAQPLIK